MIDRLQTLLTCISSGCLPDDEIARIADEAARAYADPEGFLAADPAVNYDDSFPIPLGEWVIVGSLPETVLFQADGMAELFGQIKDSFGPNMSFTLQPKQLAKADLLTALRRVQVQLSAFSRDRGGYVLLDFSTPLDDELQTVLVFGDELDQVLVLCAELGIHAAPSYQSRQADSEAANPSSDA
jgi:hypothetical protein